MFTWKDLFGLIAIILLAACSAEPSGSTPDTSPAAHAPTRPTKAEPFDSLPALLDCVRKNKGMLIAAHRGGPAPGYPENALETLQFGYDVGIRVFEIDVAESRDGVLLLMHDDRLNRTSTGDGYVSDTSWEDIALLNLVDNNRVTTDFNPPKLTDVLIWARDNGAIVELDRKPTTSFANIASAVRAAKAENNVIFISYDDDQAADIAKEGDDLMMTASVFGERDVSALEARGVNRANLIGWTGTRTIDDAAWNRLNKIGVEAAFGTLGRKDERLDDTFLADNDPSEYQDLADRGLTLLATDEPYRVSDGITADDVARSACGL